MTEEQQDKSFNSVKIKYLNFDNVKFVIFTKLELNTSQSRGCIAYKIDSGADGNLMLVITLKILF